MGYLNPPWNVPHTNDDLDRQFQKAMALTGAEFEDALNYAADSWLPGRALVEEALLQAPSVHPSGVSATMPVRLHFLRSHSVCCACCCAAKGAHLACQSRTAMSWLRP